MAKATKTVNPLHFEDLEPHRFEDLVRQLIYDYRDWYTLEATGRKGLDEGFDIRGRELIRPYVEAEEDENLEGFEGEERIWLIQCKREKTITPGKIGKYVDEVLKGKKEELYGVIFVAPCNYSKRTRDIFIGKVRKYGIKEYRLWGNAELEDMLFQPKNDHLLFAYFGISLSFRQRSLRSQIRSRLSIKRKAIKCLGGFKRDIKVPVLLRDPEENRYPHKDEIKDFDRFPRWQSYYFLGHEHDGLKFLTAEYMAYLADDKEHWDYIEQINDAWIPDNDWEEINRKRVKNEEKIRKLWQDIPDRNRAKLEVEKRVLYEKVIAIDENGDKYSYRNKPHIYISFREKYGPFKPGAYITLRPITSPRDEIYLKDENKINYFKEKLLRITNNSSKN